MSLKRLWLLVMVLLLLSVPLVVAQEDIEEQGTIDANNPEATFDLELTAGETVSITVTATSGNLDPILELLDADGNVAAQNDDIDTEGGNYNAQFTYTADADGIYTIRITAFQESEGDFLLTVAFGEATPVDSETFTGAIQGSHDEVEFQIDLTEGAIAIITVTATSGDLDPVATLYNPDNDEVAQNDDIDTEGGDYNSQITYQAQVSGTHRLVVSAYIGTGEFTVTVTEGVEVSQDDVEDSTDERPELDQTRETEHFIIHYAEDGENATNLEYVDAAAEIVEQVWQMEIEEMGWPAPPSDGSAGGDDRFDLYLLNLCGAESMYGYAQPAGDTGDNPNSAEVEEYGISSFLVVDNDFNDACFTGGQGDLLTTVAHEFFHNIQFGYDVNDDHRWYYESTATWMETQVAGDNQQATIYVSELFQTPEVCLGSAEGGLAYGTYLFIQSLVDAYGEGVVLELWQNIAQVEGFEALTITLEAYGEDIPTAVSRYALQNLVRAYPLADLFGVTVWLENTIDDVGNWSYTGEGIQELGVNFFAVDLEAGNYSAYLNGDDSSEFWLYAIGIVDGEADIRSLDSNSTFTTEGYDNVYLMVFNPQYDGEVEACEFLSNYDITVEESDDDAVEIESTLDAANFEPLGN